MGSNSTSYNQVKTDCEEECLDLIVKLGDILGRDRTFVGTVAPSTPNPRHLAPNPTAPSSAL